MPASKTPANANGKAPARTTAQRPTRPADEATTQLRRFRDELHSLFRDLRVPGSPSAPAVDVLEQSDRVEIRVDLAEVNPNRLFVEMDRDMMRIRGERDIEVDEQAGGDRHSRRQRRHFLRGLQVPPNFRPETVEAMYEHGLLTITFEKRLTRSAAD